MMLAKWKKLDKRHRNIVWIAAAFALLVMAAAYTVFIAPLLEKEAWIYKESEVVHGSLVVGVTESGSLEYGIQSVLYELDLDTDSEEEDEEEELTSRYLEIEEMYVAAGQRVTAGEALLKFTEDSISGVRSLLKKAETDAEAEYNETEAEYELAVLETQTAYKISEMQAVYAEDTYYNGLADIENQITLLESEINNRVEQTEQLQDDVKEAQEEYNEALENYEIAKNAAENTQKDNASNFMEMQTIYMNALTKYQNAQNAFTRAKEQLEENNRKITSLKNQLEYAVAGRAIDKLGVMEEYKETGIEAENAQISYQAELESLKETLQEAEDAKDKAKKQLESLEAFVGTDGILYAAEDGIITQVVYEAGDKLEQTGAILSYATSDDMTISVDVTQEDIVGLQVGDNVDISFTAYEDTIYSGVIQSIQTTATSRNSNTISYEVVVSVQGDTGTLYGGMTADVTFVTEKLEDVLYVSRKAIVTENGKQYVYRKSSFGGKELVEVETGTSNGTSIVILSGLEAGDTIYLATKVSDEAQVQSQEGNTDSKEQQSGDKDDTIQMPEGMEMPEGEFGGNRGGMKENDRP